MRTTAVIVLAIVIAGAMTFAWFRQESRINVMHNELQAAQDRVRRLSYNTASGGGVNLKLMPDPGTDRPTVELEEVFSFDRNHAICRVDTNRKAFKMSTYKLGQVVIRPHAFYMSMVATSVDQFILERQGNGARKVAMRGGLDCATEVAQGRTTMGSRTAAEHATYLIEAIDGGIGGGKAGDRFAFTAFFDPEKAPVNYSIFGPKFTFTGKMVEGEITITDPRP